MSEYRAGSAGHPTQVLALCPTPRLPEAARSAKVLLCPPQAASSPELGPSSGQSLSSDLSDLKAAIDTLLHLYRVFGSSISVDELRSFVRFFSDKLTSICSGSRGGGLLVVVDPFSCPVCYAILTVPVTLPCGHTYCKKCLEKEKAGKACRLCKHVLTQKDISERSVNVLIQSLVEKWWSPYFQAAKLRAEGNSLFEQRRGEEALKTYSAAIAICSDGHLCFGNRCQAFLSIGRSEEALKDANAAIKACPYFSKAYFRKSMALVSLGRYEEAFLTLTVCLHLVKSSRANDESALVPLNNEMVKVLHKIFMAGGSGVSISAHRRHSIDQLQFSPYPKPICKPLRERFGADCECNNVGDSEGHLPDCSSIRLARSNIGSVDFKSSTTPCKVASHHLMSAAIEQNVSRIHRLFERAIQEAKRMQKEVMDTMMTTHVTNENSYTHEAPSTTAPAYSVLRHVDETLVSASDFECTLCFRLFYRPVTTSCGHVFCSPCLERSLDHSTSCPLCKANLAYQKRHATSFLQIAISKFLPVEYEERQKQHLEDELGAAGGSREVEIPIFVCTMGFPGGIPCPLHVFEPRYRLMIRRAMESGTRRFGMCCYLHDGQNNYADFGTLLEIKNVQYFADGRSVVDTVGVKRFKVLKRSQKDGYNTALVEYLLDKPVGIAERPRLSDTHNRVYNEGTTWLKSINQVMRQRIHTAFGEMPLVEENWAELPDGPSWCWWLLAILPLDSRAQLAILSMNSLQRRLDSISRVINYMKSNRM